MDFVEAAQGLRPGRRLKVRRYSPLLRKKRTEAEHKQMRIFLAPPRYGAWRDDGVRHLWWRKHPPKGVSGSFGVTD